MGELRSRRLVGLLSEQLDASINDDVVWLAIEQLRRFHLIESFDKSPFIAASAPKFSSQVRARSACLAADSVDQRADRGPGIDQSGVRCSAVSGWLPLRG